MRKVQLLILLATISFGAIAQTEQKVKVENTDGKIHLIIEKEVDGKIITIDKTYNSHEEMKNDPELEGLSLHVFEKPSKAMFISSEDSEKGEHDIQITVDIDSDNPLGDDHNIFISSDEGESMKHNIKVWIDDDGEKHITKNGEEIKLDGENTWTDKEGNEFSVKKGNGKVIIMSESDLSEIDSEGSTVFEFQIDETSEDSEHKVMMFKSGDTEGPNQNSFTIKVVEHIKLHLKDLEENEFTEFEGVDAKSLKMDGLNYYPNPNEGKFTLEFKADNRPTQVKISSIEGKTVYEEDLQGFEGTYQNEIDLSSQKKGVYLLQIIQGNKASNKKIVIE